MRFLTQIKNSMPIFRFIKKQIIKSSKGGSDKAFRGEQELLPFERELSSSTNCFIIVSIYLRFHVISTYYLHAYACAKMSVQAVTSRKCGWIYGLRIKQNKKNVTNMAKQVKKMAFQFKYRVHQTGKNRSFIAFEVC